MLAVMPAACKEAEMNCAVEESLFPPPFGVGFISTVKTLWHRKPFIATAPT